jgi:splicing factor 45
MPHASGPAAQPSASTSAPPLTAQEPTEFDLALAEKRKALAAIAAKFATLPGSTSAPEPFEEIEGESFAEKMMRKWGHKEGRGLGSKGEGITTALSVEHVEAQPKNPAQMSKRQLAKQKAAAANAKNRKWVQHSKAHGKIVNADLEGKRNEEKERYGEASRVICLVGIVDDVDDIDEDLADEFGEECSKHG